VNTIEELWIGSRTTPALTPWKLKWMKFMGATPVVDIEGDNGKPKIVASDLMFSFTGYKDGAEGFITNPAGTNIWPPV
jgi:hypothetical protein